MHVLVLPSFYPTDMNPIGGKFFKDQVMALRKHGLEVGVAFANGRSLRRGITWDGVRTHRFQAVPRTEDGIPTVRVMSWNMLGQVTKGGLFNGAFIAKAAKEYVAHFGRPDVVHVHQARWAGHGALLIARHLGLPYVVTEHESYFAEGKIPEDSKPYLRTIYEGAAQVIAVSRAMADAMVEVFDPARVTVIPNMVDTDYFALPETPRPAAPFTFLCVARLAQIKCLDRLMAAFAHAFPGDPDVHLRIVGDGPESQALTRYAEELGVQDRVFFCGELQHDGVREAMQRAHVFVLGSDVETFGVVLIEAMACGIPVIATRCGGPEDIVTDDVGLLVPRGDVEAMAAAMQKMRARHHDYAPRMLHAQAATRFGEAAVTAQLRTVYQRIIEGRGL